MGEFEAAQRTEELLDAAGEPDGTDAEVLVAWERQRRVHLLLHARFGGDADATYASIRAAASGSRRERIADVIGRRTGRRMRRREWTRLIAPLAAAALLLIAVLVGRPFLSTSPGVAPATEPQMVLERIGPDLVVERDRRRLMPDAGMLLRDGDVVTTGASTTRVTFSDGTQVDLAAGTRVGFRQQPSKALDLQAGNLTSDVARQPPERPLRIQTPGSRIEVVGTRFTLGMEPAGTRLTVSEGIVRMSDQDGGRGVAVTADQQALGSWFHAPRLVTPFDPTRLTVRLRLSTDDPAAWTGTMYGPITADARQDAGSAHLRLGITAGARDGWGSRGIPVRLAEGDRAFALRLRVLSASPGNVIAFDMADDVDNTWRLGEMPMAPGAGWQRFHVVLPLATEPPPPRTTNGSDLEFKIPRLRLLWVFIRGVAEVDLADLTVLKTP